MTPIGGSRRRRPRAAATGALPAQVVSVSRDGVRSAVPVRRIAEAARAVLRAEHAGAAMISVALVSSARIAALNLRHLQRRGVTDVIAFGLTRAPRSPIMGDVYIAPAVARANALRHGVRVHEELVRLTVHGVLHVLGYDHPEGRGRETSAMWKRQETVVAELLGNGRR